MADTAGCHSEGVCRCDDGSAGHSLRLPHMGGIRSGVAARVMARIRVMARVRVEGNGQRWRLWACVMVSGGGSAHANPHESSHRGATFKSPIEVHDV